MWTYLSLFALLVVVGSPKVDAQPLYGYGPVTGQANFFAFSIDTQTGAFARLATVGSIATDHAALDPSGHRMFVLAPRSESFLILDLYAGALSTRPSYTVNGFLEYSSLRRLLYEIGQPNGTPFMVVFWADPNTGIGTDVATFTDLVPRSTALDDAGQRLFILGVSSQGPRLSVLDLISGVTTDAPAADIVPQRFSLHWDGSSRTLYGVGSLAGESDASLFVIDPFTGNFSRLAHLSDVPIFTSAISPRQRLVFFTTPPGTLSTFDLEDGTTSTVPIERCCPELFDGFVGPAAAVPAVTGPMVGVMVAALALVGTLWAKKVT